MPTFGLQNSRLPITMHYVCLGYQDTVTKIKLMVIGNSETNYRSAYVVTYYAYKCYIFCTDLDKNITQLNMLQKLILNI